MTYIAKAAVCSETRTKHPTQSEHHVEFLNVNLLKPTGHVTHHQFNIQQLYALPTLYFMCFIFI